MDSQSRTITLNIEEMQSKLSHTHIIIKKYIKNDTEDKLIRSKLRRVENAMKQWNKKQVMFCSENMKLLIKTNPDTKCKSFIELKIMQEENEKLMYNISKNILDKTMHKCLNLFLREELCCFITSSDIIFNKQLSCSVNECKKKYGNENLSKLSLIEQSSKFDNSPTLLSELQLNINVTEKKKDETMNDESKKHIINFDNNLEKKTFHSSHRSLSFNSPTMFNSSCNMTSNNKNSSIIFGNKSLSESRKEMKQSLLQNNYSKDINSNVILSSNHPSLIDDIDNVCSLKTNLYPHLCFKVSTPHEVKKINTLSNDVKNELNLQESSYNFNEKTLGLSPFFLSQHKSTSCCFITSSDIIFNKQLSCSVNECKKNIVNCFMRYLIPSGSGPNVYMDISIGKKSIGRIIYRLFADRTPLTAQNFLSLCAGEIRHSSFSNILLHYLGSSFHRIVPAFYIQGGDFTGGNGAGGESIYRGTIHGDMYGKFKDEKPFMMHSRKYLLSMANSGPDTNGSQFFITLKERLPHLDGKHVVFGEVVEGMNVVDAIGTKELADNIKRLNNDLSVKIEGCGFVERR